MESSPSTALPIPPSRPVDQTVFALLFAISLSHLLNDVVQALLPAIYPVLRDSYQLSYTQVGLITFTFQCTASMLQPVVGYFTDKKPMPYSLPIGMSVSLLGLLSLSQAHSFATILISAGMVGLGSAVFHPEASRIAHMAAGKRRGLAQSVFQVGGNAGTSIGPLLALIVTAHGQASIAWFSIISLVGVCVLFKISKWQVKNLHRIQKKPLKIAGAALPSNRKVAFSMCVLVALVFSKYVYLTSMTSYYTFYLINHFGLTNKESQLYLFIFLFAVAAGTIIGGPVGDKIGRKRVIWVSILGVAPFTLALPYASLPVVAVLSGIIGLVLASAFSAILVYATELMPGKVGMIAGLFFGLAFGIAGIGSAVLGKVADHHGMDYVFHICSYLPLLGMLTIFLPNIETGKKTQSGSTTLPTPVES